MSAFSRNLCSTASRTLRQRTTLSCRAIRPVALGAVASTPITTRTAVSAAFSTMSSLKSGPAEVKMSSTREYDPEIKDIASYIHNTPVDSELAVWTIFYRCEAWLIGHDVV
jgi:2-methylcitrate dehydratase